MVSRSVWTGEKILSELKLEMSIINSWRRRSNNTFYIFRASSCSLIYVILLKSLLPLYRPSKHSVWGRSEEMSVLKENTRGM